jgi:hypothetical protein
MLLGNECSPNALSATIPTAMALPKPARLCAIKALVSKGVLAQDLGLLLQTVVSENDNMDTKLMQLLLQHKAPVDDVGDASKNVVLVATQNGNLSMLEMLCQAGTGNSTLSKAVLIALTRCILVDMTQRWALSSSSSRRERLANRYTRLSWLQ